MPIYGFIVGESPLRLWGLTSKQRIERVLQRANIADIVEDLTLVPAESSVVLIRGDYLYDDRVINTLVKKPNVVLQVGAGQEFVPVAGHVSSNLAGQAQDVLTGGAQAEDLDSVQMETAETLSPAYDDRLRKLDPFFVLPITPENRRDLEKMLFTWAYKSVTDLVTKWVWPRPARWVTGLCVRYGLRPNHVTVISLALVVLAGVLFWYGFYGWGLLAGWLMTFLDTVDGKLARVTVTSTNFGHIFDHAIDIIHPPLWYIAWGLGLSQYQPAAAGVVLSTTLWLIVIFYVVGRFVELTFQRALGGFSIFVWRPTDSYFRLITGRRNPSLILLTTGVVFGRPDLGFEAVAFWTVLTSLFLLLRLGLAWHQRNISGPLNPWFQEIGAKVDSRSLAVRVFTRLSSVKSVSNHE